MLKRSARDRAAPRERRTPAPAQGGFRDQARILKALAHPSRLAIVDRLARGECSAGDLTRLVGSDQTTVSKHLALLRAHGIVDAERRGNAVVYRLVTPCVTSFLSCAMRVLGERK